MNEKTRRALQAYGDDERRATALAIYATGKVTIEQARARADELLLACNEDEAAWREYKLEQRDARAHAEARQAARRDNRLPLADRQTRERWDYAPARAADAQALLDVAIREGWEDWTVAEFRRAYKVELRCEDLDIEETDLAGASLPGYAQQMLAGFEAALEAGERPYSLPGDTADTSPTGAHLFAAVRSVLADSDAAAEQLFAAALIEWRPAAQRREFKAEEPFDADARAAVSTSIGALFRDAERSPMRQRKYEAAYRALDALQKANREPTMGAVYDALVAATGEGDDFTAWEILGAAGFYS